MIIILSNTPNFILKFLLRNKSIDHWLYFGKKYPTLSRLRGVLNQKAGEIDYSKILYDVSDQRRRGFVQWIDDISLTKGVNKEWLFSVSSVKNPYTSDLFLNVAYFFTLEKMIHADQKIDLIIVDSLALAQAIKKAFPVQAKISPYNYVCSIGYYATKLFRAVCIHYLRTVCDFCIKKRLLISLILKQRAKDLLKSAKNIVFVRRCLMGNFSETESDLSEQHCFPGLDDHLAENDMTPIVLPTTVNVKSYKKLCKRIKHSQKIIIFPEELLKASDYWRAFRSPFQALRNRFKIPPFSGYDLSDLIKEDYYWNVMHPAFIDAMLLHSFGKRIKEINCTFNGIINWAENQAIEKGLISGLKEQYPQLKVISGQPFVIPKNYLSFYPSNQDKLLGFIPDCMLVAGPIWQQSIKEFVDTLEVQLAPPFRYRNIFESVKKDSQTNNLLVLLGYDPNNAVHTLQSLVEAADQISEFDHIFIKLHPFTYFSQKRLITQMGRPLPLKFSFIDGSLEDHLSKIAIGVCGATGTATELVSRGIPVVLIAETHCLTMNYLAYKEDSDLWELCFNKKEIVQSIKRMNQMRLKQSEILQAKSEEFRREFFTPPLDESWRHLLFEKVQGKAEVS